MTKRPRFVRYIEGTNKRPLCHDLTPAFVRYVEGTNKRLLCRDLTAAFRMVYRRNQLMAVMP